MAMTCEQLTESLRAACGANLKSVILYGSAAAGDHVAKRSDYNVLVLLERLGMEDLRALGTVSTQWTKAGNPAPLLFTWDRFLQSGDVFPIELSDIKASHRILHGDDPLPHVAVNPDNMRLELEHELKGKLIHLRESFLLTLGKASKVEELLVQSLSTFLVLFRAALRLHGEEPPVKKLDALEAMRRHIDFDADVFKTVAEIKEGKRKAGAESLQLFDRYLKAIETVTDAVDAWTHPKK